jgi:hypothetical protein
MLEQFGLCTGRNGGYFCNIHYKQLKSISSMELEERHIIRFLHLKDLTLQEIAAQLSGAYGQEGHTRMGIKYWLRTFPIRWIRHTLTGETVTPGA